MKEYIKPELDVIEIKASDIYTGDSGEIEMPEDMLD